MSDGFATPEAGYTNRPPMLTQAPQPVRPVNHGGRRRAVERMRLALQAYEQRAQRRAALHGWIAARAALVSRI